MFITKELQVLFESSDGMTFQMNIFGLRETLKDVKVPN